MFGDSLSVLEVEGISKLYSRNQKSAKRRLSYSIVRIALGLKPKAPKGLREGEFWSLKNIGFSLRRGEALGVIGLNGAGKTTLLRILSGQILPDSGEIRIVGRAAAMIDLTAGFQMSASGRRNILLRGAMLGRSAQEMKSTFDDVVEFAELGDAINAPVSTYSSGMLMRLAFAIMITLQPDVLFIDEILAVGDFKFRQKCLSRIRQIRDKTAIVLVSHSMADIKAFCSKAILLNRGEIAFAGSPEDAVVEYEKLQNSHANSKEAKKAEILAPQYSNEEECEVISKSWCDKDGRVIEQLASGEDLYFRATVKFRYAPKKLTLGIPVWSEAGQYVTGFSTERDRVHFRVEPNEQVVFVLKIPSLAFNPGLYVSNFSITDGVEFLYRQSNPPLEVQPNQYRCWGIVSLTHEWLLSREANESESAMENDKISPHSSRANI